jgi:LPXTG-motif cell wall-anchored protein
VELRQTPVVGNFALDALGASLGPAVPQLTVTGPDGRYRFAELAPGPYAVVALRPAASIEPSFDTDGLSDWSVAVTVAAGDAAVADFAGVGAGTVTGTIDAVRQSMPTGATVTCAWAGLDGRFGTTDDGSFTTTATSGSFVLTRVPYGEYSCAAASPGSTSSATPVNMVVSSSRPTAVTLKVPAPASGSGRLPATGRDATTPLRVASILLALGGAIVVSSRRSRATSA